MLLCRDCEAKGSVPFRVCVHQPAELIPANVGLSCNPDRLGRAILLYFNFMSAQLFSRSALDKGHTRVTSHLTTKVPQQAV